MFGSNARFCNITNYELKTIAMLEVYGDTIKEIYIWFENVEKKNYIY